MLRVLPDIVNETIADSGFGGGGDRNDSEGGFGALSIDRIVSRGIHSESIHAESRGGE